MTGVDASPLMTWGEIEGTPFRLDGSDTPVVPSGRGPVFKIPEVPRRDRLAHELAEKASKAHRDKKEAALKQATASLSRSGSMPHFMEWNYVQFLWSIFALWILSCETLSFFSSLFACGLKILVVSFS